MSKQVKTLSDEALSLICSLLKNAQTTGDVISDTVGSNTTYSSLKIEEMLGNYAKHDDMQILTSDDIEAMLGLSENELQTLASLISDTEISISKAWSSSKIYSELNTKLDESKAYTLQELSKAVGASYKVVTSMSDMTSNKVLYLYKENDTYNIYIFDTDTSDVELIGSFEVSLDDYMTRTELSDTFATKADVAANYVTKVELQDYAIKEEVAETYATKEELEDAVDNATVEITTTLTKDTVSDTSVPSSKVVYDAIDEVKKDINADNNTTLLEQTLGYECKNLLLYPYLYTTQTIQSVEWTDNGDGTVTANGTNDSNDTYSIFNCVTRTDTTMPLFLEAGTYILNGCPSGGSDATYRTQVGRTKNNSFEAFGYDYGEGVTFTLEETTQIQVQIMVGKGATVNNITFKPMIRHAEIEDDTYVPYKKNVDTRIEDIENDYLPKSGGTINGTLTINNTGTVGSENVTTFITYDNGTFIRNKKDANNRTDVIFDENELYYAKTKNGVTTTNTVVHSGNVANYIGNNNVRYNEETDFLQVFFNNSWIDIQKLNLQSLVLYVDGSNGGQFVTYAGNTFGLTTKEPTLTLGDNLTVSMSATDGTAYSGSAISKAIDLTAYNKLTFTHNSTSDVNSEYHRIQVHIVTQKASSMSMYKVLSDTLLLSQTSNSGEISMDISGLSGEHYITIEVSANNTSTVQTVISNMVLTV